MISATSQPGKLWHTEVWAARLGAGPGPWLGSLLSAIEAAGGSLSQPGNWFAIQPTAPCASLADAPGARVTCAHVDLTSSAVRDAPGGTRRSSLCRYVHKVILSVGAMAQQPSLSPGVSETPARPTISVK